MIIVYIIGSSSNNIQERDNIKGSLWHLNLFLFVLGPHAAVPGINTGSALRSLLIGLGDYLGPWGLNLGWGR